MSNGQGSDVRAEIVDLLLQKIATDRHPSIPMMDFVERLLTPDDLPLYAGILMDKVRTEKYPSVSMIKRLLALAS